MPSSLHPLCNLRSHFPSSDTNKSWGAYNSSSRSPMRTITSMPSKSIFPMVYLTFCLLVASSFAPCKAWKVSCTSWTRIISTPLVQHQWQKRSIRPVSWSGQVLAKVINPWFSEDPSITPHVRSLKLSRFRKLEIVVGLPNPIPDRSKPSGGERL